ncbi:MAG: MMPL family transporter, partial [Bacteroidota bacterium]
MGRAFLLIYSIFHRNLWAFILFLLLLIGFVSWFASQIRLEEDINRLIPRSDKNEKLITVLQHSKFADRLVFCVSMKEADAAGDPALLISYAESLIDSLKSKSASNYIRKIEDRFTPADFTGVYKLFYENLPLFLDDNDYDEIEVRLGDSAMATAIKKDYEALITAGGFAMRDFILKDPLSLTPIALKKLESLKVSENFELVQDYIISKDKRNLLFFIIPAHPSTETSENARLLKIIDAHINKLDEHYQYRIASYYFGSMAVAIGNATQIKHDIIITVSIAGLVLLIFLGIYFRKKLSFLLLFLPALTGGGFAIAILAIIKPEVSAISLGLGSVMLGISIDYALHFLSHLRHTGSVKMVINDIASPVMMSSLTTASAFLCLLVLKSEALRDLGIFAALSVFSSAIFTLLILPHFFKQQRTVSEKVQASGLASVLSRIASYAYDRNKKLSWGIFLLLIIFIFTSGRVRFESSMDSMNFMSEDLLEAEEFLDSISSYKLRSVFLVSTASEIDEALMINESIIPETDSLLASGTVKTYTSVHPFFPSTRIRTEKIRKWKEFWPPEKVSSIKQSIISSSAAFRFKADAFKDFYTLMEYKSPPGPEAIYPLRKAFLDEYISEDDSLAMVTTILKVKAEDKPDVYKTFDGHDDVIIFDRQSLTSSFMESLRGDFDKLILLSLLVVFVILTLSFGRIELGIITFIPLLISWVWTLGIMGLLGVRFNIFNVVISTFIFGLGIDYAIFCMRGLVQEYQFGRKKLHSYKTSILLSGITTIVGIGVLIFAKHPALQSIAISAIIGILSVVLITYTLLPRLFRFLIEHEGKSRKWPVTFKDFIFSINTFLIFLFGVTILNVFAFMLRYLVPINMKRKKLIFHKMLSAATWTITYGSVNIKKFVGNSSKEDFKTPAIVICNHQSHLDTMITIMLNPKMILLTTPWVQKSIFFGWFIRFADFYSVAEGFDNLKDKMKALVKDGYSILYFPEGTRSPDMKIGRFHQGAFYLAKELGLDILPLISYGSGNAMP